jgi:hypothetical protein
MIIELVDATGESVGRFQSQAVPHCDETVSYAGEQYLVTDVAWFVETDHNQNVENVRLEVRSAED